MALGTRRAVSMVVRKVVVTGDVRSFRCRRRAGVCLSEGGSSGLGSCAALSSLGVIGAMVSGSLIESCDCLYGDATARDTEANVGMWGRECWSKSQLCRQER